MTNDMVTWLRQQLDDAEAAARLAARQVTERQFGLQDVDANLHLGTTWRTHAWLFTGRVEADFGQRGRVEIATIANDHIALHDPASVLADIASKRAILDWHTTPHTVVQEATEYAEAGFCSECDGPCTHAGEANCACCGYPDGCPTIRCMAAGYAHRAGYNQEWKW